MLAALALTTACGQKGPPLPPLVLTPAAPADLVAERRGATVDIRFNVPEANTNGSRPANVSRVDVYAFTGSPTVTEAEVLRLGSLIASVPVKTPDNPTATIGPEDPASDLEPLEGPGLEQGAAAHVSEQLDVAAISAAEGSGPDGSAVPSAASTEGAQPSTILARSYVGLSVNSRGRPGALSRRAAVPFVNSPPPPSETLVTYDQAGISIHWTLGTDLAATSAETSDLAFHVYEIRSTKESAAAGGDAGGAAEGNTVDTAENRLTTTPVTDLAFVDRRIEWGVTRCFTVRTVRTLAGLTVESEARPPTCTRLIDTFAPVAPSGLEAIASDGAISLIWDPSEASDLAGYLVRRGPAGSGELTPVTPAPIAEASFRDVVPSGTSFMYDVQAVDRAGNISPPSDRVEETAR
jgi:hypothetical protein